MAGVYIRATDFIPQTREGRKKLKKLSKIRLRKILDNFYTTTVTNFISGKSIVRLLLMANNRIVNKSCLQSSRQRKLL